MAKSWHPINGKVHTTISDNASNIIRALFTLPNTAAQDDAEEDPGSSEEPDGDPSLLGNLPRHYPCFKHTLQLVVHDGLRKHWPDRPSAG